MRLVRFGGAMSPDGYIAGPSGEHDWIVMDPEIDCTALMKPFDKSERTTGAVRPPG